MDLSGLYREDTRARRQHDLRFDVDGDFPQLMASGTVWRDDRPKLSWRTRLRLTGNNTWSGRLIKRGQSSLLRATTVRISRHVRRANAGDAAPAKLDVDFMKNGRTVSRIRFRRVSKRFREVNFEFDHTADVTPTFSINTKAHPNCPPSLTAEQLTIMDVYERAGFHVTRSRPDIVPIALARGNARWNEQELNDAMEVAWSRFSNEAQWALWVFTTGLFEPDDPADAVDYGGVMFDYRGSVQRQGTAIFNDSFVSQPPPSEHHREAWVKRMQFWTTCHEMGHGFNLAHSWEKTTYGYGWVRQVNLRNASSFMNYPFLVTGGTSAFFADFQYRFIDSEIQFLRHAPNEFVQMGGSAFTHGHAFKQDAPDERAEHSLRFDLVANRQTPIFDFLEPIVLELRLTNVSKTPQVVDPRVVHFGDAIEVTIKKRHKPARRFLPFLRFDRKPTRRKLAPGESVSAQLFLSAGAEGWYLSEPGSYRIRVSLSHGRSVAPGALTLTIMRPRTRRDERIAQDYFTMDVGRTLAVDGSRVLDAANKTLQEIVDDPVLQNRAVAVHAAVALGCARATSSKRLDATGRHLQLVEEPADVEGAFQRMHRALVDQSELAKLTLGRLDYKSYCRWYAKRLDEGGRAKDAHVFRQVGRKPQKIFNVR